MLRLCTSAAFVLLLSLVGAAAAPAAVDAFRPAVNANVTRVAIVKLDDGSKAFIGSDNKFYLIGANGVSHLAPPGHYHSADGGSCFNVMVNGVLDPAMVKAYLATQHQQ
jgi:hypothetical protein